VNDIAFNTQGNLLYSCSSEKNVLEWNMRDGSIARKFRVGSEGAMKVAVSAEDETLAVGGTAIRTFDLTSGKKTRKLTAGLSSTVNQLVFSKCKRFLFSSTIGGRFVNLYDLNLDQDEPVLNFSMPSSSSSLFAHVESQKKKSNVLLGAVSNTGSLFLWRHKYKNESSTQPLIPTVTTKVKNGSFASILLAGLKYQEENAIVVARGSLLKPVFEKTKLVDKHNNFLETLEFEAISDNLLLGTQQKPSNNKKQKVEDENEKTHIPNLAERGGPKMSDMKDMSEEFVIAVDEESEDDLTLAEKVEALREQVESDLAAELRRVEDAEKVMEQGEKPDASSLSSVLEQALQTKDNSMLEYCLRTRDPKIINNTIKRVSSVKILQLLDAIVVKFEKSPGRCSRLCPWIRSILLNHTAYLMTQPDLVQNLSALYQILENRLKVHEQLQKLSGRLSLVIGQINEASYAAETDGESDAAPRIVYHEGIYSIIMIKT
jgi:U3 small nucleolar RNA-associated protein 5